MHLDLTPLSYLTAAVVLYHFFLFVLSKAARSDPGAHDDDPHLMVLVIPAHNEELVLGETLLSLSSLDYSDYMILLMNDGSTDATSELAHLFSNATGKVKVVDRPASLAGRGKGDVLNHAFRILQRMHARQDPELQGWRSDQIIVGVVDADGRLDKDALREVEKEFRDPGVGAVQVGVRIANARDGFLLRLQDMEFVGFSGFVQRARHRLGSVGLGGNGQFVRFLSLQSLPRNPWSDRLAEDLDLGISIAKAGWKVSFCGSTFVAQQGVPRLKPLVRQRSRWIQGHYQCWGHLPSLLKERRVPLAARLDLSIYLTLVLFVVLLFLSLVSAAGSLLGWVTVENDFLGSLNDGVAKNLLINIFAFGPLCLFLHTYQKEGRFPLRAYELPAYAALFALYSYVWVAASFWAFARMLAGRRNWAKTRRVKAQVAT